MSLFIKNCVLKLNTNGIKLQQLRFYPRWQHRRPARVFTPEEYEQLQKNDSPKENIETEITTIKIAETEPLEFKIKPGEFIKPIDEAQKIKKVVKQKKEKTTDMLELIFDENGDYKYTKMDNKDRRISEILVELKSKKEKETKQLALLEGKRLIKEALKSGVKLKYLLFSRFNEVDYLREYLPKRGINLYKMPYKEIQMWSDLQTSPGIMGIIEIPDLSDYESENSIPVTIICDNIRQPDNLGAILRGCAAVGCERVILTRGCVNLWNNKVLRSSSGCQFHLQIHVKKTWDDIKELLGLNCSVFVADNRLVLTKNNDEQEIKSIVNSLPLLPYYSVQFKQCKHVVVIVGSEADGLSLESYRFAIESQGSRIMVPLNDPVDSLNAGTALGVIAFEIKRQLIMSHVNEVK